jgi:hypothetical protein
VGFQLDTRVSVQAPSGSISEATGLSSLLGARTYWAFDLGWKVNDWLFLGGYVGVSMGGAGGAVSQACQAASDALAQSGDYTSNGSACLALSADIGGIAIASLNPSGFVNPWVGVGLGYEHQTYMFAGANGDFDGPELPVLLAGVEFRTRTTDGRSLLGIGPYLGATFQKYSDGQVAAFEGASALSASTHTWIHVGARMTVLP